ncbi:hypothetical protein [Endozoicomonas numazuensis]|uniref:Uncharacterized protein n=1 Tax=Endozoicomonas numazuensis TaxID=1137799 RepID=A0A081NIB7_9GAMM|nr:hypothetical protein [Endozoicomonas numazuensis]KEQ18190.1 hypothetical protein GZ78_11650 [Endozoicomonas numazuensis]
MDKKVGETPALHHSTDTTPQQVQPKSVKWKGRFKVRISEGVKRKLGHLKTNPFKRSSGQRRIKRMTKEEFKFRLGLLKPSNWASRAVPRMDAQIKSRVDTALSSLREGNTESFMKDIFSVRQLMHQRAFYTGEGHAQEDFLNSIEREILNHPEEYTGRLLAEFADEGSYLNRLREAVDNAYDEYRRGDVLASNHLLTLSSARSFLVKLGQLTLGEEAAAQWLRKEPESDNKILHTVSEAVRRLPPGRLQ